MNQKNFANFNLNQSIHNFQVKITELLQLNNLALCMNSFEIAKKTLKDWGIKISLERISRLTYKFGRSGLSIRNSKILALEQDRLETDSSLKDKRVIISVDGGRTRIRNYDQKKTNPKTKRRKYTGEWIEPKLLTIYTVDEKAHRPR